jgi:hypothetical protein
VEYFFVGHVEKYGPSSEEDEVDIDGGCISSNFVFF